MSNGNGFHPYENYYYRTRASHEINNNYYNNRLNKPLNIYLIGIIIIRVY